MEANAVAQVARPSVSEGRDGPVRLQPASEALPATCATGDPLNPPSRSEPVSRGAGCVNRARPDLRAAEVRNHLGLPDWAMAA